MNDLIQQFVNWLPQFSNTPAGLRIGINASHVWALVYPAIGAMSLLTVKRYVSKFFARKKQRQDEEQRQRLLEQELQEKQIKQRQDEEQRQRLLEQELQEKQIKKQLPDPWFSLYKRLQTIKSMSAAKLLVASFVEQFSYLPTITPEGYRFLLRSTEFAKKDKKGVKFLLGAVSKYVRYQTGTEPVMVATGASVISKETGRGPDDIFPGIWHELRDNLEAIDNMFIPDADKDEHRTNVIRQFTLKYDKDLQKSPLPYSTYVLLYETFRNSEVRANLSVNIKPRTFGQKLNASQINKNIQAIKDNKNAPAYSVT